MYWQQLYIFQWGLEYLSSCLIMVELVHCKKEGLFSLPVVNAVASNCLECSNERRCTQEHAVYIDPIILIDL